MRHLRITVVANLVVLAILIVLTDPPERYAISVLFLAWGAWVAFAVLSQDRQSTTETIRQTIHEVRRPRSMTPHDAFIDSLRDMRLDCELWRHDECPACGAMNWTCLTADQRIQANVKCWCCNRQFAILRACVHRNLSAHEIDGCVHGLVHPILIREPEAATGGTNTGNILNTLRTAGRYCIVFVGDLLQREGRHASKIPCGHWDAGVERPFRFAQKIHGVAQEMDRAD